MEDAWVLVYLHKNALWGWFIDSVCFTVYKSKVMVHIL